MSRRVRAAVWGSCALLVLAGCAEAIRAAGQGGQLTPLEVKAGFLLNLVKFVEWPVAPFPAHEPIAFAVMGSDPLINVLSRIVHGQSVKGHAVIVRKYNFGDDLGRSHVLFIGQSEQSRISQVLGRIRVAGASILTVSDAERFVDAGGVVQFVVDEDRVHFSVNREAATQAGLQISAQLLTLSRVISNTAATGTR